MLQYSFTTLKENKMQTIAINRFSLDVGSDIRIIDGTLNFVITRKTFDNAMMLLDMFPAESVKLIKVIRIYGGYDLRESKAIYDAAKQVKAQSLDLMTRENHGNS